MELKEFNNLSLKSKKDAFADLEEKIKSLEKNLTANERTYSYLNEKSNDNTQEKQHKRAELGESKYRGEEAELQNDNEQDPSYENIFKHPYTYDKKIKN